MARFYICQDQHGATFDCTTSQGEALTILRAAGGGKLVTVDAPVTKDTVVRLLGNLGGYATRITETTIRGKS